MISNSVCFISGLKKGLKLLLFIVLAKLSFLYILLFENLISKFKSVRRIKKATADELLQVEGITPKLASKIIKNSSSLESENSIINDYYVQKLIVNI